MELSEVFEMVTKERDRQDLKWGWPQDNSLSEWATILGEEYGEFCQEVLRVHFGGEPKDNLVDEVVQVAAVCAAIIQSVI